MSWLEIKAAVLQLPLAERSELVEPLLQSIESPPVTNLGIVEGDFDAASSKSDALRPIGLRANVSLSAASIFESLAPLSGDDLEVWSG